MHSVVNVLKYRCRPGNGRGNLCVGAFSREIGEITIKKGKFEQPRKSSAAMERERLEQEFRRMTGDDQYQEPERSGSWKKKLLIVLAAFLVVILAGTGVFLYMYSRDDGLIFKNVYALDVNLEGMTQEEAARAIADKAGTLYAQGLTVQLQDRTLVLTPEDTGASLDAQAVAKAAYEYGRDGNMFQRAKARSSAALTTYTIDVSDYLRLDTAYIREAVNQLGAGIESTLTQPSVTVEGAKPDLTKYALPDRADREPEEDPEESEVTILTGEGPFYVEDGQIMRIQAGVSGRHLDTDALYDRILKAYGAGDLSTISITYDEVQPEALDLAKVFEEYCTQPVDAVLDEETYVASKETLGYGFVPEEVQLQLDALPEGGSLEVEYQILVPEHTKASLEADLFKDVLSHSETEHTWNNNRTNNLILACEAIDGYILKPGATFSFNEVVGERTEAKGYREATVFAGMESKPEVGGGVCQVASTLYVCTLYADLEVVERAVHTFEVSYVPLGLDATVYWGSLDYKFRNNTDYPIRIDASVHDGVVDISFVGTETKDYYIEMRTEITSTTPWKTVEKEITDGSYEDGETITSPYTGYTAKSYKQKWDRATETMISEEFEADSRYTVRDKVVAVVPKTTTPTSPPATDPPETDPTETDPPETDPPETDPPETDPPETDPGED